MPGYTNTIARHDNKDEKKKYFFYINTKHLTEKSDKNTSIKTTKQQKQEKQQFIDAFLEGNKDKWDYCAKTVQYALLCICKVHLLFSFCAL